MKQQAILTEELGGLIYVSEALGKRQMMDGSVDHHHHHHLHCYCGKQVGKAACQLSQLLCSLLRERCPFHKTTHFSVSQSRDRQMRIAKALKLDMAKL